MLNQQALLSTGLRVRFQHTLVTGMFMILSTQDLEMVVVNIIFPCFRSLLAPKDGSKTPTGASGGVTDDVERRANSLESLKLICGSAVFSPHLEALLAAQDAQGNTPFMAAVSARAYPAALVLFDAAQKVRLVQDRFDHQSCSVLIVALP